MDTVCIGCGAAGEPDRPDLALQMVESGNVEYVGFDTLAERTLALAQQRRLRDPALGYDPLLRDRLGPLLGPARERGIRLAGNVGGANPAAAAEVLLEEAGQRGVADLRVGVVTGDDLLDAVRADEVPLRLWGEGADLDAIRGSLVSANAYLGFTPILDAFEQGADVVVTGRTTDIAPYLASLFHRFGWERDDLDKLAAAAVVGHLLECGRYVTGANHDEPGWGRRTPGPEALSLPLAEVDEAGSAVITKVPRTGGHVNRVTCSQQLLHEIDDARRYLTPDVTLDITGVELTELGADRVRVGGGRGSPPPDSYKVLLGVEEGWIGEAEASFAGRGAVEKARDAAATMMRRLTEVGIRPSESRVDVIGVDSVLGVAALPAPDPLDVRLRISYRLENEEELAAFVPECQELWMLAPVGVAGVRAGGRPVLAMHAASVPREEIEPVVTLLERTEDAHAAG